LAQLLWPDSTPEAARNSLRQRLFQLRRSLGAEAATGEATLALAEGLTHDLHDAAVLLADEPAVVGGEYGAWLQAQRERRRLQQQAALVRAADAAEAQSDWPAALAQARALLALAPLAEDAHRRLIRLHYLAGDGAAALLAFDRCEQVLKDEVGARPSPLTLALLATVEQSRLDLAGPQRAVRAVREMPGALSRPPRTVGRADEAAWLRDGGEPGQVQALIADAGMGKTRLLQDLAARHPPCMRVAARPGDAAVPMATLARLQRALQAGTGEGAVVLLLDELHFADAASLQGMQAALLDAAAAAQAQADAEAGADVDRRPVAPPSRWVLAYRPPDPGSPLAALHHTLQEAGCLQPRQLRPLDGPALAAWVDSLALPGVQGAAWAPALLRHTGGNPHFALETLKQAWAEGLLDADPDGLKLPRPAPVTRLIEQRLGRLREPALTLARVAAIAGDDFDIELAAAVLQVPVLQLADAANDLEAAHVLGAKGLANDLVLGAVRAGVPAVVAAHTHGRVAQGLAQRGGPPAAIARHWLAAGQAAQALPGLRAAAEAARLALRGGEQVTWLLQAAGIEEALGDADAAFETVHALLEARIDVDRQALGWQLCDRLDALARSPAQRGRALQQRAWFALNRGELQAALAAAQALLALAQPAGDTALCADAWHVQALALSLLARDAEALAAIQQAQPVLSAGGASRTRAEFHGTHGMLLDNSGQHEAAQAQHRQAIAMATDIGYHAQAVVVRSNLALSLRRSGLLLQALAQLQQAEALRSLHDQMDGPAVNTLPALTLLLTELGRHGEALACCDRAEAHLAQHSPAWLGVVHNHRALIWVHLGQWARAAQALRLSADSSAHAPGWLTALRHLHQARLARYSLPAADAWPQALAALEAGCAQLVPSGRGAALWQALTLERCALLPPDEAYPLAQELAARALALGHHGMRAAATARAAASGAALHQQGRLRDSAGPLRLAERAQGLLAAYQPNDALAPEVQLNLLQALLHLGPPGAAAALAQPIATALRQRAAQDVPAPFRESFLQRQPVNAALLALAARSARAASA
jgi:DNA-binding SARP family transcriptional activator